MFLGLQDVKKYHRAKICFSVAGTAIFLLYAGLWVYWGGDSLLRVTENRWLGLFIFVGTFGLLHELLTLPFSYYTDFVFEHRYEQSNQTFSRWLSQLVKGWGVGGVIGGIILAGLYACLWYTSDLWWLWVWLSWVGLTVVLAQLFPVLLLPVFYKSKSLDNASLAEELTRLAEGTSIKVDGIFSLNLSADTKAANAMLTGLGSTRRVYLSDTLLEAFTAEEIEVIFAHELGHHVRKHIWKSLLLSAVISSLNIAVLVFFLHPLRGTAGENWASSVQVLPWISLVIVLLGLVIKPLPNAISRRFERQCDNDALRQTENPHAYRSAFTRLAEMNLADPEPHPFVEWYFHDHPAIAKRLALAGPASLDTD